MRLVSAALLLLSLSGCPRKSHDQPQPPADETATPYHNVRPQKVKADVERIQKQEDERNDKRLEEAK